jgi:DNA/RNA endonuclease YhcR with UshA esterase domain
LLKYYFGVESLNGKVVEVIGKVKEPRGKPEIVVEEKEQVMIKE